MTLIVVLTGWVACSGTSHNVERTAPPVEESGKPVIPKSNTPASGQVDLDKARQSLKLRKFEKLLDVFEPNQVESLSAGERAELSSIFYQAALVLREKFKNVSFSSMFCERALMLKPEGPEVLRLQVRNYLHPDMKLYGGAEELVAKLLQGDPADPENQLLRGKVAFEQGEYDTAVVWLEKAARIGRERRGKVIEEAWHLLGLAKGKRDEIRSSLSMTRELETRFKRARKKADRLAKATPASKPSGDRQASREREAVAPRGGRVVLYMTSWCKYCQKAQTLLQAMKVKYQKKDIEKDESALMEMMRFAKQAGVEVTGVPVLRIGNKMVVGYNPQRIEMLIDQIR